MAKDGNKIILWLMRYKFYLCKSMKKVLIIGICMLYTLSLSAQCSLCTRTAQQLGKKPAQGLNGGIVYLMIAPFAIVGFIGYKWYFNYKKK